MAKIVVLASGDDADAAKAALEGASMDFEIVDPTPSNLLHIVIGMVGDEEEEPKEEKEPKDEPAPEEEPPPEESADEIPPEEVPESLGTVVVNGETIKAVKSNSRDSFLYVNSLVSGQKTSYTINESTFSFWPADAANPVQRVLLEHDANKISLEIDVRKSRTQESYIGIGANLAGLFQSK